MVHPLRKQIISLKKKKKSPSKPVPGAPISCCCSFFYHSLLKVHFLQNVQHNCNHLATSLHGTCPQVCIALCTQVRGEISLRPSLPSARLSQPNFPEPREKKTRSTQIPGPALVAESSPASPPHKESCGLFKQAPHLPGATRRKLQYGKFTSVATLAQPHSMGMTPT